MMIRMLMTTGMIVGDQTESLAGFGASRGEARMTVRSKLEITLEQRLDCEPGYLRTLAFGNFCF